MKTFKTHILFFSIATVLWADWAQADIFHLTDGGRLTGQLSERGDKGEYIIKTQLGGNVTLAKDQVQTHVRESEHQREYEARGRSLPDTVAAHRSMVAWCKEHKLSSQAEHHLERIIALDPNDEQARTALGYQKHQGKWFLRNDIMAARGMRFYDGAYRTAQDIALRERDKAQQNTENEWFQQLKLWRSWLDGRRVDRADEALTQIRSITDPQAASSLVRMLAYEKSDAYRPLWMEVFGQVKHPATMRALINLSITEPERETRMQCVEYLLGMGQEIDIAPYVKALRGKDNDTINIAAEALTEIGDPDAISPLIDALVTRHKIPLQSTGEMSASFSPDGSGGGGLSAGNKPKFIQQDFENVAVRRALIELSGDQDFGFNKTAWQRWYENQRNRQVTRDPRRDE